jgi:glycosyltransferase involved in cell wall biosynthesis
MRLVYVIDSFMLGGSELAALRTFRLLRPFAEISVVHFHADGPLLAEYRAEDAALYHVPVFGMRDVRNLASLTRLHRLLASLKPDVIHSHDAYSNMATLATQWPMHRTPWISSRRWLDQIVRPSHARLNRVAFRHSSAVAVNSSAVAKWMLDHESVSAEKLVVIPNFVDVPELTTEPAPSSHRRVIIGMVSRLTPVKRHDIALHALRLLVDQGFDVGLVVIGEGTSRPEIEQMVCNLHLTDRVTFLGEQRGGARLHLQFDICLSTSDSEGSPNSVLEAMAAGRPVVATDVGGTRDLIRHSLDGYLVPAGEPRAVADAIRMLLLQPANIERMGAAGRQRALKDFSPAAISKLLLSLYNRVIS